MALHQTKTCVENETHNTKPTGPTSEFHSVFTSILPPDNTDEITPALFIRLSGNDMRDQKTMGDMNHDVATENRREQNQSLQTPPNNPDQCIRFYVKPNREQTMDTGPSGSAFFHQEGLLNSKDVDAFKTFCFNFQLTNDPASTPKELFND